jgi:peroxiredoxin
MLGALRTIDMTRSTAILCNSLTLALALCQLSEAAPAAKPQQQTKQPARPKIPAVLLSKQDAALCRVRAGDPMPAIALPQIGGGETKLTELYGKKATVVVFWKSDRRMTLQQLSDIGPDIIQPFGQKGVAVVGIAVKESQDSAEAALKRANANFRNLLDADGKAFAEVGSQKLPRTYLLDASGKIVWFDIEYSLATRRELQQALRAISGGN